MEKDLNKPDLSTLNFKKETKFILKLVLFVAILFVYIWHKVPQYSGEYTAALIDKVDRLTSLEGPKIVLIGNSNVAFGFNSEYIEDQMGMPVVNMGLHGALGNKFHDDMMDYNIHEGDIYVVAHSSYWNKGKIDDHLVAWNTVENHPKLWHLIKREDYIDMVRTLPAYIKEIVISSQRIKYEEYDVSAYSRKAFNEYGDVDVERTWQELNLSEQIWLPVAQESELDDLNKWYTYLSDKGAYMVVTAFPLIYDQWPGTDEEMDAYQNQLSEALECDVISEWRDYAYDSSYFFDTEYHLTEEGAQKRSEQLVKDLKRWQSLNGVELGNE